MHLRGGRGGGEGRGGRVRCVEGAHCGGDAHLGQHSLNELARAAVAIGGGHDVAASRD